MQTSCSPSHFSAAFDQSAVGMVLVGLLGNWPEVRWARKTCRRAWPATSSWRCSSQARAPRRCAPPQGCAPISASIGLALATPGESVGTLLARADSAMYAAKRAGKHYYAFGRRGEWAVKGGPE